MLFDRFVVLMHNFYLINKKILLISYNLSIAKSIFLWYNTSTEEERKDGTLQ